jgi:RNA polymerase sigma-70 factor (ECF subfamily)
MVDMEKSSRSLLDRARSGDRDAAGLLLARYRNYLRMLAQSRIDRALRVRCDDSDLVQETLFEALRDFSGFAGTTEQELMAWLRRILLRNLADQLKHHNAKARTWSRQESLDSMLDRSSPAVKEALMRGTSSPSGSASRREEAALLGAVLARLPADYREVLLLRNYHRLPFEQVAERMGRSPAAVRMLWVRSLERLHRELEGRV